LVSSILTRLRHFFYTRAAQEATNSLCSRGHKMPDFVEEAIICFENVSRAIMAEQALVADNFDVRVMPAPAAIQGGCGFCLRFFPEDLARAAAFLSRQGFDIAEAYSRRLAGGKNDCPVSYDRIPLANGGVDAGGL